MSEDEPPDLVARLTHENNIPLAIVFGADSKPVGLFIPSLIHKRLPSIKPGRGTYSRTLRPLVSPPPTTRHGGAGCSFRAAACTRGDRGRTRASTVSSSIPPALAPYECEGGPHYVSTCPCGDTRHANSKCGRPTVDATVGGTRRSLRSSTTSRSSPAWLFHRRLLPSVLLAVVVGCLWWGPTLLLARLNEANVDGWLKAGPHLAVGLAAIYLLAYVVYGLRAAIHHFTKATGRGRCSG